MIILTFINLGGPRKMYEEIEKSSDNLLTRSKLTSISESTKSLLMSSTTSIPIERPPGMSGVITCNSYKNRHGDWHRRDKCTLINSNSYNGLNLRSHSEETVHIRDKGI